MSEILEQQNKVIISLLARNTIGVERIDKIVRSHKRKGHAENFVAAYNALDGLTNIADIAKIVGITRQGMSAVLQAWEEEGIVYKVGKEDHYVGLLKLPTKV